ncbi:heavy metal translocating P-type ATPase [Agrilactobacillus yilanensis]|uniref:Cd(2+)-exporting ATPase n=1 Tax=Agrilactobacillus yilanensis TaxID=2485997 RepID=A0ABW4J3A8_9LACO|nr:heavy metal translocating P-type ATPase [Agrilactobacillus yilanensis]
MGHKVKFGLTIIVGVMALLLAFIFKRPDWAQILVTIVGGFVALGMLWEMVQTIREGQYGIDLLAIIAIVSTLAVGEYWASLMVLLMLTGGDSLEDYAANRASSELQALLENSPQVAHRQNKTGLENIKVDAVNIGDHLVVKPNELVPVDGHVLAGFGDFDESSLTGESQPVSKEIGDRLLSGSVNGAQSVTMIATHTAEDSQYQALVKLVQTAKAKPAHFVRMADRYAVPFTAISLIIAGIAWFVSKDPVRFAEVLVVASPCPLILAAPISLVAGMSRASKNGIVIKSGDVVEKMATAKAIAFDKTGTLTQGKLTVEKVYPVGDLSAEALSLLAASVEQHSNHILARSLVAYVQDQKLEAVQDIQEVVAQGVQANVNGQVVRVGKAKFADVPEIVALPAQTAVYVSIDGEFMGYLTFTDQLRPETKSTLERLRQQGLEHLVMLTGDNKAIAKTIGQSLDLDEIHGDCLPEDKINLIQETAEMYQPIMMVGDGVNDAPSLATADVGIAMGAHGATAASESADVVILKDDLTRVANAVQISQETMQIAKRDVLTGIVVLVILMLIATTGVIPALLGAILQEAVDTMTILLALKARSGLKAIE